MSTPVRPRSTEIAHLRLLRLLIERTDKNDEINFRMVIWHAKLQIDGLPKTLGDQFSVPPRWVELWAERFNLPAVPSVRVSVIDYILELVLRRLAELGEA